MDTEKNCENCAYFSQHYSISGSHLIKACAHCLRKNGGNNYTRPFDICKNHKEKEPESDKDIKDALQKIAKRLNEIAMILNKKEK